MSQTTGTVNTGDFDIAGVTGVTAGRKPLVISSNGTDIAPLPIPVAELVINELDADQPVGSNGANDTSEFIELATGLPNTSISTTGTTGRTQVSEGAPNNTNSISRCAAGRLNGDNFARTATPTPGALNSACP